MIQGFLGMRKHFFNFDLMGYSYRRRGGIKNLEVKKFFARPREGGVPLGLQALITKHVTSFVNM
jgi:hypothetical protein